MVCQVDRLCRTFPASIRNVLDDLPKTLDETYARTLQSIDEEKREYAQRLFRCLTVSIRPLRVEELAEILAIRFGKAVSPIFNAAWHPANAEEAVMSACSSLISVIDTGDHQIVEFSHFSVKEYLTSERLATADERLSYYHILPEPAHMILAHAGLSILLQLDDKIDRDVIVRFPLSSYAARHWVDHAQFRGVSSHIHEAMKRLFDPAKPYFAAWVWLYDIDRCWAEPMSTIHPMRPEAVPLYYASLCGFRGLVEHLTTADSSQINIRGGSHTTPLHAASVKGHLEVASLLLESGADPNSRDYVGRVPLHRVSQGGQLIKVELSLEIARLLVNCGAKANVTDDDQGDTPVHAAARSGYRDVVELLVGSGSRIWQLLVGSGTSLDVRNKIQETPLHVACANGMLNVSRFLIDRGSDVNSRDDEGFIPLHTASRFGHVEAARLLLDCGSDVNACEAKSCTPLHFASRFGYLDLARLLIDRGADVHTQQADGWTPLHHASRYGYLDLAWLLMDRGADVHTLNADGWTPMHLASANGHFDIVKLLVEHGAHVDSRESSAHRITNWAPRCCATIDRHWHTCRYSKRDSNDTIDFGV